MSRHVLEVAGLRRSTWSFAARADRPSITWWPASLPGSDLEETPPRRRRPARRPLRRGRIQLVRA